MKGLLKANIMTTESSFPIFPMFCRDHVRDDESNHLSTVGSSTRSSFLGENEISNARHDEFWGHVTVYIDSFTSWSLINRILWCIPITFRWILKLLFQESPNTLPHWELFALHSNLFLKKPCATFGKLLKTGYRTSFGLTAGYPAKIPTFPGGSGGLFGPELFLGEASGSFGVDGWVGTVTFEIGGFGARMNQRVFGV